MANVMIEPQLSKCLRRCPSASVLGPSGFLYLSRFGALPPTAFSFPAPDSCSDSRSAQRGKMPN
eukprot:CAMPEP_0195029294 /NCGR_PEP_ID=MMETSP0326_2-20130528/56341_1 /TAXON_ID=2866 ORGANISM="Crypthecodinium cohnii, Strain Seligo" /NCGR_SAMPLE_ID=MMETSP0326_2 /ASSEMBLY_ACC=CAM_ASM_000348 /LENGTH=63 /DNA_ID=CAMNT_0040052131 /DNA_START=27 /DNA_END=215 /DNA_ORIENTATION=-